MSAYIPQFSVHPLYAASDGKIVAYEYSFNGIVESPEPTDALAQRAREDPAWG